MCLVLLCIENDIYLTINLKGDDNFLWREDAISVLYIADFSIVLSLTFQERNETELRRNSQLLEPMYAYSWYCWLLRMNKQLSWNLNGFTLKERKVQHA